MPRVCTACTHPERDSLEGELVRGGPIRRIAADRGLSESALRRHAESHLPATLTTAERAREAASADQLLADLLGLEARLVGLADRAEAEGDVRAAVVALREARECVALRARVAAELCREEGVSVPEARDLIARSLEQILRFVPLQDRDRALQEAERLVENHPVGGTPTSGPATFAELADRARDSLGEKLERLVVTYEAAERPDLSTLTDDELRTALALARKANGDAPTRPPAEVALQIARILQQVGALETDGSNP